MYIFMTHQGNQVYNKCNNGKEGKNGTQGKCGNVIQGHWRNNLITLPRIHTGSWVMELPSSHLMTLSIRNTGIADWRKLNRTSLDSPLVA
jgi:hypothetical protein